MDGRRTALGGSAILHADGIDFRVLEPRLLSVAMFIAIPAAGAALMAVLVERRRAWWWIDRRRTIVACVAADPADADLRAAALSPPALLVVLAARPPAHDVRRAAQRRRADARSGGPRGRGNVGCVEPGPRRDGDPVRALAAMTTAVALVSSIMAARTRGEHDHRRCRGVGHPPVPRGGPVAGAAGAPVRRRPQRSRGSGAGGLPAPGPPRPPHRRGRQGARVPAIDRA